MSYWDDREIQKLNESEQIGLRGQRLLAQIYEESYKEINRIITKYLEKESQNGVIPKSALNTFLTGSELAQHNEQIDALQSIIKRASGNELYDKNFTAQITRLEAIKREVYWQLTNNINSETPIHERTYKDVLQTVYQSTTQDIEQQTGFYSQLTVMDNRDVVSILKRNWEGSKWSSRLWKNNQLFAKQMPVIIGRSLLTGSSIQKTARIVRERFGVRTYVANRLVRTETNYFHGQGELQSYIDEGIQKYMFSATIDGRQSKICEKLNEQVFLVKDAEPGVNMHPMHPNCRSTTKIVIPEEWSYKKLRAEGGKNASGLEPVSAIEDLEERWGLPRLADTAQVGMGRGTYIAKINQGADNKLNTEAEWIMKVWGSLSKVKKAYAMKRLDRIVEEIKDPGQASQVEFLIKMLDL